MTGVRLPPVPDEFEFITPDPPLANKDLPDNRCFVPLIPADLRWCTFGNPNGAIKVALVGDSKMQQWLPVFEILATQNDWNLAFAFKGGCPFTSAITVKANLHQPNAACTQWNGRLLPRLVAERPDYVITSQTSSTALDSEGRETVEAMVAGMRASWSTLAKVGTKVIVIANNPSPGLDEMRCVHSNRKKLSNCAFDRAAHELDPGYLAQRQAVAGQTNASMIDLFDVICPTERCPPVIGNVMIYRKGSHLTATFVKTMAPHIARKLSTVGLPVHFS